jgi:hypothetical protein
MHLELLTTDAWYEQFHEIAEGIRPPKPPKVFREALLRLLIDHANMVNELNRRGVPVKPIRERVKLK